MRWIGALAAAGGIAGVEGGILDADRQVCALDRRAKVAADVGGQCLERRNIQRVQALMGSIRQFGKAGQEPRQRLSAPRGRDQKRRFRPRTSQHIHLVRVQGPAFFGEPSGQGSGQFHAVKIGGQARASSRKRRVFCVVHPWFFRGHSRGGRGGGQVVALDRESGA